jgi:general secretion pathway protein C
MGLMMNSRQTPAAGSNGASAVNSGPNSSLAGVRRLITSRWLAARNIVWIANLALAALLGYFVWGLIAQHGEARKPAPAVGLPAAKESPSKRVEPAAAERGAGGSRPLFASSPVPATSDASGDAPATQLQLKLLGTIAGGQSLGLADIQDSQNRMENLYHVGDTIQGAKIEEIARRRVVLLVDGRREVLEMAFGSPSGKPTTAEAPRPATTGPAPSIHEVVKVISPNDLLVNKHNFLARVGSVEAVLKTVKLEPYVVDGKTAGMKITGLSDDVATMAALANVQNGDVIQNINGQNLTSPQKTFQTLQKARTQPALDMQILRGDTVIPLHFSMSGSE